MENIDCENPKPGLEYFEYSVIRMPKGLFVLCMLSLSDLFLDGKEI